MPTRVPRSLVLFAMLVSACSGEPSSTGESSGPSTTPTASSARAVVVNGNRLDPKSLADLDRAARTSVPDGDYWYDARSGACGANGGPTAALLPAGLQFGAALRADASGGGQGLTTGVFVNGRELHLADCVALSRVGGILPGRYWLDANGNWGVEGIELPLGNLLDAARSAASTGPGYNRTTPGGHLMSDGQTSGWFDPKTGASVLVGN